MQRPLGAYITVVQVLCPSLLRLTQHPCSIITSGQHHFSTCCANPAVRVCCAASQFVFWVVGTVVGGALGFLAMWHPALALNPYGLVAVVVAVALVVGLLGVTKARVAITLLLMTLSTLILVSSGSTVDLLVNWTGVSAEVGSVSGDDPHP